VSLELLRAYVSSIYLLTTVGHSMVAKDQPAIFRRFGEELVRPNSDQSRRQYVPLEVCCHSARQVGTNRFIIGRHIYLLTAGLSRS